MGWAVIEAARTRRQRDSGLSVTWAGLRIALAFLLLAVAPVAYTFLSSVRSLSIYRAQLGDRQILLGADLLFTLERIAETGVAGAAFADDPLAADLITVRAHLSKIGWPLAVYDIRKPVRGAGLRPVDGGRRLVSRSRCGRGGRALLAQGPNGHG